MGLVPGNFSGGDPGDCHRLRDLFDCRSREFRRLLHLQSKFGPVLGCLQEGLSDAESKVSVGGQKAKCVAAERQRQELYSLLVFTQTF
jgi:hypothetical protein